MRLAGIDRALAALAGLAGLLGVALSAAAAHIPGADSLKTAAQFLLFHAPAILALVGIVQDATYSRRIYGFWQPVFEGDPFRPFVNRNHFAGYQAMAILLGLGAVMWTVLPIDAFPDVSNTQVMVLTNAPGLAPAEVACVDVVFILIPRVKRRAASRDGQSLSQ